MGACESTLESFCTDTRRGTFQGAGTSCADPGICTGPCCLSDEECIEVEQDECSDRRSWFGGLGGTCGDFDCTPSGACCGFGECWTLDPEDCNRSERAFRGEDTSCSDPGVCDGPCCLGGGCALMADTDCWEAGGLFGVFEGPPKTECAPCTCFAIGACCLPGGECVIDSEFSCSSFQQRTYLGGQCGPNSCSCKTDVGCQDGNPDNGQEFCDGAFCRGLARWDYSSFAACLHGPEVDVGSECWCADRTADDDADLADAAHLFNAN